MYSYYSIFAHKKLLKWKIPLAFYRKTESVV